MLRSWTNKLEVYLHPQKVVVIRRQGLIRPNITHKKIVRLTTVRGSQSWESALLELQKCLAQQEFKDIPADVTLSGHFLRHRVAPWDDRLKPAEREVLVRHQFREVYGPEIDSCHVFIADGGFRKNGLACAISSKFLEGLKQVLSPTHSSIQPFFVTALNQLHKKIAEDGCLVLVEQEIVYTAFIKQGGWQSIRCKQVEAGWEDNIQHYLEREAMQQGTSLNEGNMHFFWPENSKFNPKTVSGHITVLASTPSRHKLLSVLASKAYLV